MGYQTGFIGLLGTLTSIASTLAVAEDFDPFAQSSAASPTASSASAIRGGAEFIYRGSYIPDLLHQPGIDQRQDTLFGDLSLSYQESGHKLATRGLLVNDRVKIGDDSDSDSRAKAMEAYYEYTSATSGWYGSLGRKNLGWSSGFQWRPADVIDNGYTTKSVDMLDPTKYTGIDQLQAGMLGDVCDWALIASNQEEDKYRGKQYATRFSYRGGATYSLLLAKNGELSRKAGLIVDSVLPYGSTLAIEAIATELDEDLMLSPGYFGHSVASLSGEYKYLEVFATFTQFYDEKTRTRIEYFYNGAGFDQSDFTAEIGASISRYLAAGYADPLVDKAIFSQQNIRRNYVYGAYTGYWQAAKLEIEPNLLVNLDDHSYIGSLNFRRAFWGRSELSVRFNWFRGDRESEYGGISPGTGVLIGYKIKAF